MLHLTLALSLALFATGVLSHGLVTVVTGANGVIGQGMGVDPTTPRDGSRANPFQRDTSILRSQTGCGRTAQGTVSIATEMQKAMTAGAGQLPSVGADGSVTMTIHQVNGDGAGPFSCDVSADASGTNFQLMQVTTQVPGRDVPIIGSLSRASAEDFPLVATMPAGMTCTGGPNGNACVVPFGSCASVQMGDGTGAATVNGQGAAQGSNGAIGQNAAGGSVAQGQQVAGQGTVGQQAGNNQRFAGNAGNPFANK